MLRFAVCLTVLISFPVAADEPTASPPPETRSIWNCDSLSGTKGLELETTLVKEGQAAVRWRNHPEVTGLAVPNIPADWSRYNQLRLWIHNANPVPTRFMIILGSETPNTEGSDSPSKTEDLKLEIVVGRDEPVLGFAPASRKKPIPVLDYQLDAAESVTMA